MTVNVNFLIGMLFIILRIRVRMRLGVRGAGRGRRKYPSHEGRCGLKAQSDDYLKWRLRLVMTGGSVALEYANT